VLAFEEEREQGDRENDLASSLDSRPEDDEPLISEERTAVAEGRADVAAGRLTSLEEVEGELGF
jgi:hypothetical protein